MLVWRSALRREHGAAALEFALVVPLLLVLLLGIAELGRIYHAQITLSAAAREGVRAMALQNDPAAARARTLEAAPTLQAALAPSDVDVAPAACPPGGTVTVTISHRMSFVTDLFGDGLTLTGQGVMRCGD